MTSTTMQAIGFREYGAADVLQTVEVPRPQVAADSVLIRVAAAGINPADWRIRKGQFRIFIRLNGVYIPGIEVAGIVEAVGADVTHFKVGEAVYAALSTLKGGGYAQFATAPEKAVAHIPPTMTFSEAAALPLCALTAYQGLRDKVRLQAGQHILIGGASGGVGTFAVQIAKAMGATVTAVTSTRNLDLVKGLGADRVIDYTRQSVTSPADMAQYDAVFDAVNHYPYKTVRTVLKRGGTYLTVNPLINLIAMLQGRAAGHHVKTVMVQPKGADLEQMRAWLQSGAVRTVIDQAYMLNDVAEAHRHSETGHVRGKLVLRMDKTLADQKPVSQPVDQTV